MTLSTNQAGLSYVEALLAVVVLAVALVPALSTLQTALTGAAVHEEVTESIARVANRMEVVLAEPFADLDAEALAVGSPAAPTSYSDAAGPGRLLVYLSRYDGDDADGNGDPFDSGMDEGLLWVRVAMENSPYELTTLVSQ